MIFPRITAAEADGRAAQEKVAATRRQAAQEKEATRRQAAQESAQYKTDLFIASKDLDTARSAYRLAEMRFELAQLVGQLREFICELGQKQGFDAVR